MVIRTRIVPIYCNKRVVVAAINDITEHGDIHNTSLSMEQLNHLCTLLTKKTTHDTKSKNLIDSFNIANVAGTFCFFLFI